MDGTVEDEASVSVKDDEALDNIDGFLEPVEDEGLGLSRTYVQLKRRNPCPHFKAWKRQLYWHILDEKFWGAQPHPTFIEWRTGHPRAFKWLSSHIDTLKRQFSTDSPDYHWL